MKNIKVDGLKKIDKRDVNMSRKIVLDTLKDAFKEDEKQNATAKNVDGIIGQAKKTVEKIISKPKIAKSISRPPEVNKKSAPSIAPLPENSKSDALVKKYKNDSRKDLLRGELLDDASEINEKRGRNMDGLRLNTNNAKVENIPAIIESPAYVEKIEKKEDEPEIKKETAAKPEIEKPKFIPKPINTIKEKKAPRQKKEFKFKLPNLNLKNKLINLKLSFKAKPKDLEPDFIEDIKKADKELKKQPEKPRPPRIIAKKEINKENEPENKVAHKIGNKNEKKIDRRARRREYKKLRQEFRKNKLIEFKAGIKRRLQIFIITLKKLAKLAVKIVIALFVICIFVYAIFVFAILKFDFDTAAARTASKYLPVPALITTDGIVNYYDYKDIKENLSLNFGDETTLNQETKIYVIKKIAINQLAHDYKLKDRGDYMEADVLTAEVEKLLAYDEAVNIAGINRIQKLKELLNEGGDFVRLSNKYGDEIELLKIDNKNKDDYGYSGEIINMQAGEISEVIFTPEGYYIFECVEKRAGYSLYNSVFVKAQTLDEYLEEMVKNYKMLCLVN